MEIQRGGFHLRRFVIGDLARVLGLVHMTVDRSYAATYCPEARAAFKGYASADRIAADADAGFTLVAESNGEVVGTASLVGDETGGVLRYRPVQCRYLDVAAGKRNGCRSGGSVLRWSARRSVATRCAMALRGAAADRVDQSPVHEFLDVASEGGLVD